MPKYLLVGNYGVGNSGDEILRDYFLEKFPEIEWVICSANPVEGELPRFPSGIRSLLSFRWIDTLRALRKSDGMVFGGGTMFTDVESVAACWIWFVHALFAWVFRKPIILAFQGIGPFRTRTGEWFTGWVVRHACHISVRDSASYERIVMLKTYTEIVQSSDPSILLLQSEKAARRTQKVFIVVPRLSTYWENGGIQHFAEEFNDFEKDNCRISVVSLQPENKKEHMLCTELAEKLNAKLQTVNDLRLLPRIISDASFVITQRYHGAIAALACSIPFIAIKQADGDKLDDLAGTCGCSSVRLEEFSGRLLKPHWESAQQNISKARIECIKLAQNGAEAFSSYIQ